MEEWNESEQNISVNYVFSESFLILDMNDTGRKNRYVYENLQDCYQTQYFEVQNVESVIRMLDNDLTVPFIARYRKKETGGLDSDVIRKIQEFHEGYKYVKGGCHISCLHYVFHGKNHSSHPFDCFSF